MSSAAQCVIYILVDKAQSENPRKKLNHLLLFLSEKLFHRVDGLPFITAR